jgi:kinetochore protein Spc7/SPC105
MDMTRDYREDNLTRKSLGRRVSFANHAHVRLFEVPDHNTNSTASPQSSPAADPEPDTPRATNDENAYPGAQRSRRRSSGRHSMAFSEGGGEESMDMDSDNTAFSPSAFFKAGSIDDGFNDVDGPSDGDDMDVTEVVPRNFVRKQSLSFGLPRQPLASLSIPQASPDVHNDQEDVPNETSYVEEESAQSQSFASEGDVSLPMEFTVPLIRPPEPPSEAWLALRSATHSGNEPYIPSSDDDGVDDGGDVQEMELTDAVSRLQAARASLGLGEVGGEEGGEDSFTSTEDSFMDEDVGNGEDGNQTVNVTQLMRRVSIGPGTDSTVTSVFSSQEQSREEVINQAVPEAPPSVPLADSQEIYPAIPESPPSAATPADPRALYPEIPVDDASIASAAAVAEPTSSSDRLPIFSAPQPTAPEAQSVPSGNLPQPTAIADPLNFTFTPKPRTPAPPVHSRSSSPTKAPPSPRKLTAAFAPPITRPSPRKRPSEALDTDHGSQPGPAKRPVGTERLSITPGRGTGAVRVLLSPFKSSPLKTTPLHVEEQHDAGPSKRTSVGFRRPSGYFAQRKSLGNVVPNPTTATNAGASLPSRISPIKKAAISQGRKSIGSIGDSAENGSRGDATNRRSTSPIKVNDPEGQEQSPERPSPLDDIPIRASPRRKSLAPIPDDQNAQRDHDDDVQWRGEVEDEAIDDAQGLQISIEQFFEMTGIRFMDDIAAPRRSIVHPSVLRPSRRASTEAQIPLAEYVVAMAVNVPQLELYSHVSKDLQTWVERIKEIHREAEEEAQKATPPLFQEFVTADESGQAELLHQLKLIKAHNHAQAKSEWYDWKVQWVEQLYQKANEGFKNLEAVSGVCHCPRVVSCFI